MLAGCVTAVDVALVTLAGRTVLFMFCMIKRLGLRRLTLLFGKKWINPNRQNNVGERIIRYKPNQELTRYNENIADFKA